MKRQERTLNIDKLNVFNFSLIKRFSLSILRKIYETRETGGNGNNSEHDGSYTKL